MSEAAAPTEAAVLRKAALRLVPFLGLLYFTAYLDRVNVGYAALTMNADIGLSAAAYGLGAGIFFIGYFLFEVPSNLILEKVGARVWIARIMVTWGLLSAGMAFVDGPTAFYVLRFLLGVAEAGFFPGMILYLTYWFPWAQRAKIVAAFMMAIPISSVIGAPLSTALLDTSLFGLKGWQTMFILEGVPAAVLGVVVFFVLADRPAAAKWLTPAEKQVLQTAVDRDQQAAPHHLSGLGAALAQPKVWGLAIVYFGAIMGNYGLGFWLPQIVKGFGGLTNVQTGLLSALPYLISAVAMFLWSRHSDRTGERLWHFAGPAVLGAAAFVVAAQTTDPVAQFSALALATICINCALPMFWSFPTQFLRAAAAAGGIAFINSIGNLAGYVGPSAMGFAKEATGFYGGGLLVLAGSLALAAVLAVVIGRRSAAATV
ncbi:MFS transporter [Phenylobacterium sp.]|jgi:ACS family tartrate transporter-like MFS transporter|uniref:MFS transporter n=1 Tax=Phenylobacterium sp. TaxID=1871053 RepID=UPI002F95F73E